MSNSFADQRSSEVRSAVIASWVLLGITCGISLIPFLGFLSWLLGSVTIVIAIILGIVAISKGGTWHGVFILLASLLGVPIFIIVAPFVSTVLTGSALEDDREEVGSGAAVEIIEERREDQSIAPAEESSAAGAADSVERAESESGRSEETEEAAPTSTAGDTIPASPSASGGPEQ